MATRSRELKRRYSARAYKRNKDVQNIKRISINVLAIITLIIVFILIRNVFFSSYQRVNPNVEDVKAFRIPHQNIEQLKLFADSQGLDFPKILALYSIENNFFPSKVLSSTIIGVDKDFVANLDTIKSRYRSRDIEPYRQMFSDIIDDIKYFPIPRGYDAEGEASYMYGDSWGAVRNYRGEHVHEGTDIMDRENIAGRIPIVSMTDGVISDIGWSELGGFRIGIVSPNDVYYYYAHFDRFANGLTLDTSIRAGQILGYMGNSGYDKREGTKGKFPVHLHVGIMPNVKFSRGDTWINPYPYLRYIESSKVDY